jgi:hypothetical protein
MRISQIIENQTKLLSTDLLEIEDVAAGGVSKKILGSGLANGVKDIINPMTALGDVMKGGAAGILAKLAIGSANQRLFVNAAGTDIEYGYGSKVVAYTRDMTLASGDVAYTGAGFKPRSIIILSGFTASFSIAFGDITNSKWRIRLSGTNLAICEIGAAGIISLFEDTAVTKYQAGSLKSLDADGCTITWTKGGSPAAANGNFIIMYLR